MKRIPLAFTRYFSFFTGVVGNIFRFCPNGRMFSKKREEILIQLVEVSFEAKESELEPAEQRIHPENTRILA